MPGSAAQSQGETEYRRSAPVKEDGVETALSNALTAWREGATTEARRHLLEALMALG